MKIMTILGTRPEIIRLSRVIPLLDRFAAEHVLVHTGQNFDEKLSDLFFRELGVRQPDVHLALGSSRVGEQIGRILGGTEDVIEKYRPDRILILGDTNSGLAAIMARRFGIPVYHMEAGNRCYDDRVPEEVNRRVIDHCSTVLMPYTERSRQNLLREGIPGEKIFVTGNPIKEVLDHYEPEIASSRILEDMQLSAGKYFLVTMHRSENVDIPVRLKSLVAALEKLHDQYGFPVICSLHPRTRAKVEQFGIAVDHAGLKMVEPLGFFDFVKLEKSAFCLLSDSGTVQEEGCLFRVPNVTIRDVTERPETIEGGSNVLASCDPGQILAHVQMVTSGMGDWRIPPEYLVQSVSNTVVRIVLGYAAEDLAGQQWSAGLKP
jgi:UDP-N-acetylglucosamine 2-epimerase (non-hydrolysing)